MHLRSRLAGRLGSWREGDEDIMEERRQRPQDSDGEDNQDLEMNAGKVCSFLAQDFMMSVTTPPSSHPCSLR